MKKSITSLFAVLFVALLPLAAQAQSTQEYRASFTFSSFAAVAGAGVAPQQIVSGWIDFFDVAGPRQNPTQISNIADINLTIAGHTYTVSETRGELWPATATTHYDGFGGFLQGEEAVALSQNDFFLGWDPRAGWNGAPISVIDFQYAVAGLPGFWTSTTGTVTVAPFTPAAPVPEPSTWAFVLAGLVLVSGAVRHQRKAR